MPENSFLFYALTAMMAFVVGLSKGGLGGTLGALATPIMALVLPTRLAIGLVQPVLMLADIFAVALHWGHWKLKLVGLLLPGAVVGVTVGTYFIKNTPTDTLKIALAIIVLLFALFKLFETRIMGALKYQARDWHGLVAGTIAGFASALAHYGGPPVDIYLLYQEIKPRVFVATAAIFFFLLNWIKVPYYFSIDLFDFELLGKIAWVLVLVPVGVWVGRLLSERIPRQVFNRIILILLAMTSLALIWLTVSKPG